MTYADLEARLREEQRTASILRADRDARVGKLTQENGDLRETIALNEREITRLVRVCDMYEARCKGLTDTGEGYHRDAERERVARMAVDQALMQTVTEATRLRALLNARDAEIATFKDVQQGQDALVARLMGVIARIKTALVGVDVDPHAPYEDEHGPIADDFPF
jgi:chromosome segregation ATPase